MSIPADTPALVTTSPESTHRSPDEMRADGWDFWSWPRAIQWVVALIPSRRPAAPSTWAPVHTDAIVAPCSARREIRPTCSRSPARMSAPRPPGTIRRSMGRSPRLPSTSTVSPFAQRTDLPSKLTARTSTRRSPSSAQKRSTSQGPIASSSSAPSKKSTSTARSGAFVVEPRKLIASTRASANAPPACSTPSTSPSVSSRSATTLTVDTPPSTRSMFTSLTPRTAINCAVTVSTQP